VARDVVVEALREGVDGALKGLVLERDHASAVLADEVVMVVRPAWQRGLEVRRSLAAVESSQQT
jgi:hypothetical protein